MAIFQGEQQGTPPEITATVAQEMPTVIQKVKTNTIAPAIKHI
jgi:hypothetical protein